MLDSLQATDCLEKITQSIAEKGYIVIDGVFDAELIDELVAAAKALDKDQFHQASIGRNDQNQLNSTIRQDHISWVDENEARFQKYLQWMEALRQHVNSALFLGLFEYECHIARYDKGAFYKKHLDAFRGQTTRRLTTILYLNEHWQMGDGGELVIYKPEQDEPLLTIQPELGRMVVFLSEMFPHEVLPANRQRYSLTGWFRVNNTAVK